MRHAYDRSLLIHGRVVLPGARAGKRYLHIEDGLISSVGAQRPDVPPATVEVTAGPDDWIFPGLLDLHSHCEYNVLPIWDSPIAPFDNRFGWRGDPVYRRQIRAVKKALFEADERNQATLGLFGELQAVAGGTTVLQESYPLDQQLTNGTSLLLCRDTADPEDLLMPKGQEIRSIIDFFAPDEETGEPAVKMEWQQPYTRLEAYVEAREAGKLSAVLAHLAEGRAGFGRGLGTDPYSRKEFEALMAHPAMADAGAVRSAPFTIIHGSGIDPHDPEHVHFLRERNISVVWSPVSNLLLYGDTLDVEAFLDAGINLALGSDWSPSGSKHVWDEAKFARFYLDAAGVPVSDAQIFQMVTESAARCLGSDKFGRIRAGAPADFFVVRSPISSSSPMEVFLRSTDREVQAVVVAGRPIYGEQEVLRKYRVPILPLPRVEGTAARTKAVHLPPGVDIDFERDLQRVEDFLKRLGILRSNTLASSDVQYRARIAELKAQTVRFGWSVQRFRHERWKESLRERESGD